VEILQERVVIEIGKLRSKKRKACVVDKETKAKVTIQQKYG
jgi:hypothetical protein